MPTIKTGKDIGGVAAVPYPGGVMLASRMHCKV